MDFFLNSKKKLDFFLKTKCGEKKINQKNGGEKKEAIFLKIVAKNGKKKF